MSGTGEKLGWKSIPMGGVSWKSSEESLTGEWRGDLKPVIKAEDCKKCLFCWVFCPDAAIHWNGEEVAIKLEYCKGCGICAEECPFDAIEMVKE